jgi:eukaryotic-like serine/threonine-protein kinase
MGASLGDFQGTSRFRVERCLGAGAHGVVYQAWDGERGAPVALKTLREVDPAAIYRLKNEFRALADVSHPNLIALHELVSEGEQWFFTMDLIEGVDFTSWVRPGWQLEAADRTDPTLPGPWVNDQTAGANRGALDEGRLRAALRQLVQAVIALHDAGRVHRDIKPSNVLVTGQGRLVLLDFGLAMDLQKPAGQSSDQLLAGTASYMAPEQAAMLPCAEASDWYAVGVMLYEALTGRLPFSGSHLQVLMDKQKVDPPAPSEVVAGVPRDLSQLCNELLGLRPEDRPRGREILQRLGGSASPGGRADPRSTLGVVQLVGRQEQLRVLASSMAAVRQGKPATVFVHGRVGAGTTSLVRHFAESIQRQSNAVVLSGQCYERESVPYKALDNLVDALARHLSRLPSLEAETLLPRDVHALSRMFPVLRRVVPIATAPRRSGQTPDLPELRRRATNALRDLLGRIADRHPLVLAIDGLQWGDRDSAALLGDILRPPDAPPLLLIAAHRSDDADRLAPLQMLRASLPDAQDIEVPLLSFAEATQLASVLLERAGLPVTHAGSIARESAGNPSFVLEMVRYLQVVPHAAPPAIALDEVIRGRIDQLPAPARRLLEAVSVAGQPVPASVAARSADVDAEDRATLALLRSAHLVRGAGDGDRVESYHDHIRQTVIGTLSAGDLAERHLRLAQAMEASQGADPEAIAVHYRAANRPDRAAEHAAIAAARASEALAFDRAARLYRLALDLRSGDAGWAKQLEARLGDALANAGRGADSAEAYLRAASAPASEAAQALELRRRAAEQYLRSGHVDEGLEVLRGVLATVGIRFATTPRGALLSLLWRRIRVRLRGLRYQARDRSQVSPEQLSLVDVYWSGAVGLGMIDILRASAFQARHLLLALRAGEPTRIALALAAEGAFEATSGGRAARRGTRLVRRASRLAESIGDAHAQGFAALSGAAVAFLGGRWRRAYDLSGRATAIFRERCTGVAWEVSSSQLFSLWSLFYLGDLGEIARRVGPYVHEANERGDLYAAASFRTGLTNVALLVRDDVKGAREQVRDVLAQWSRRGFHFEHYWSLLAQGIIDLYDGSGREAYERIARQWKDLQRALLLRIQQVRVEATHLRARSALAALGQGLDERALLAAAQHDASALGREDVPWARVVAGLLQASIAAHQGKIGPAEKLLREAASGFDALEMSLFAAAARRRLGVLLGGAHGSELVAAANERMAAQGIVNPERMTALLAP